MRQALPSGRRRGVALLAVVLALALVSVMLGAATWQLLAHRHTLQRRQNQAQAVWLARAGVERAAAHLLAEPAAYTGETVKLIPDSQLRIAVKRAPGQGEVYEVVSEARFPTDAPNPVVRSLTRHFRRIVEGKRTRLRAEEITP
jgi:hypothetical protein